jgi:hypothetical protein
VAVQLPVKRVRKKRNKRKKPLSTAGLAIPSDTDAHKEGHFRASESSGLGIARAVPVAPGFIKLSKLLYQEDAWAHPAGTDLVGLTTKSFVS